MRKAIRGLRAMEKLGKLAGRALAEISEGGHFDGRAPWLAPAVYGKKYSVKYSRFPALPTVSRETVPGYGPLRFSLGKEVFETSVGGLAYQCLHVVVHIASPNFAGRMVDADVNIGYVKLNQGGQTFYPRHHDEDERSRSIPLLVAVKRHDALHMAKTVAEAAAGPRFRTDPLAAVYYGNLSQWLVEDGYSHSFLRALRKASDDYRTVRRILCD